MVFKPLLKFVRLFLFLLILFSGRIWAQSAAVSFSPDIDSPKTEPSWSKSAEAIGEAQALLPIRVQRSPNLTVMLHSTNLSLWITFTDKITAGGDFERYEFLKREGQAPVLYYHHERVIDVWPGHRNDVFFINDFPASKSGWVFAADPKTGKHWSIDEQAYRHYVAFRKRTNIKPLLPSEFHLFSILGISLDDGKVLLQWMDDQDGAPGHVYQPWYCVVNGKTGKVLEEKLTQPQEF
jgi:hypothetical protein